MESSGRGDPRARYRFVHATDLRLDAPVRGIALPPEPLRATLRDASLRAWQSLVELVVERDAAFLIVTGELFAGAPTLRARVALRDGLERLRAHGAEVFIAPSGDAAAFAATPWLGSAIVFPAGSVSAVPVVRDGLCLATLYGRSGESEWPPAIDSTVHGRGLSIGVLGAIPGRADENAPEGRVAYWAVGRPPTTMPRTLGAKGCVVVDVEEDRIAHVAEASVDHVRFVSLEVDIDRCADLAAIRRRLARALAEAVEDSAARLVMAEGVLRGEMVRGIATDRLALETSLLTELRRDTPVASGARPAAWWVRVRAGSVRNDRAALAAPWDLRRILFEHGEAVRGPLPGSRFLAQHFAPLLRQWGAETDLAAHRELVRDATGLALDRLSDEDRA